MLGGWSEFKDLKQSNDASANIIFDMFAGWKKELEAKAGTSYEKFVPVQYATRGSVFPAQYKVIFQVSDDKKIVAELTGPKTAGAAPTEITGVSDYKEDKSAAFVKVATATLMIAAATMSI